MLPGGRPQAAHQAGITLCVVPTAYSPYDGPATEVAPLQSVKWVHADLSEGDRGGDPRFAGAAPPKRSLGEALSECLELVILANATKQLGQSS